MVDFEILSDVGESLVGLLLDEMGNLVQDQIALASPGGIGEIDKPTLTLFLYRVSENGHLKNARRQEQDAESVEAYAHLEAPPLPLELYYLLTAHPATGGNTVVEKTTNAKAQHQVLGRAMQVLQDNSVLRGPALEGALAGQELRISMNPADQQSTDEVVSMWNTFQKQPYQPSVSYLVTPVFLESREGEDVRRVEETRTEYYTTSEWVNHSPRRTCTGPAGHSRGTRWATLPRRLTRPTPGTTSCYRRTGRPTSQRS